jgi:phosphate acetyltransferase
MRHDAIAVDSTATPTAEDLFQRLVSAGVKSGPLPTAICWPCNSVSIEGALDAASAGLIEPHFIGPKDVLRTIAGREGFDLEPHNIVDVLTVEAALEMSIRLCRSSIVKAVMKGSLHTDTMMHAIIQDRSLLVPGRRMSHVFIAEAPLYARPLFITDAVVNIYPKLEDKVEILRNAVELAQILGIHNPKVAVLSAIETVNPKIVSTLDAAALCKMADRGQIMGAVIDGPLAFDTAISAEAAQLKGFYSSVSGQADILLVPDLESGNMLAKQLEYLGNALLAGVIVGAKVPIILTSRADSPRSRVASCAVASALVHRL